MADENLETGLEFDLPKNKSSIIKVIGVGGGGSNAVNHMKRMGINGVDFVVCNTDAQALDHSPVENRIQLGANLTEGLGAGANPEVGRRAAEETKEELLEILKNNTKMVFITAGMGGGTGTGAAPVIARLAKEMNILTVGIVTRPFKFEGRIREKQAVEGIEELRKNVDSLIVINNDKLREVYGNLSFRAGFAKADEVLATAAKGIAEVITYHFTTNIDLKDVRTVLENSGTAIMGSAQAGGDNRAYDAIAGALDSPLLNDNHIEGATNVLLLIVSSGDEHEITMDEMSLINEHIQDEAGGDTNVIMGIGIDNDLGEAISVTVIATGFPANRHDNLSGREPKKIVHPLDDDQPITKGVFEKPLTDIDAPSKPMRKKVNNQPDLFSSPDTTSDKVVHGLYEEEEQEEVDLVAETDALPPVTALKTDLPLAEQFAVEPEDEFHVLDEKESDDVIKEEDADEALVAEDDSSEEEFEAFEAITDEQEVETLAPVASATIQEIEEEVDEEINADVSLNEDSLEENEVVFEMNTHFEEEVINEEETFTLEEESLAVTAENEDEISVHEEDADDMTFELDDIEGDGIYLEVKSAATAEVEMESEQTDYDPFDLRIEDVLKEREIEEVVHELDDEYEQKEEVKEEITPTAEISNGNRVIHTLDDYRELEQRLQIKKPVQEEASAQQVTAQTEAEEDESLLKFEVKTKEPSTAKQEQEQEADFLNRPISAAMRQKILERKNRLEEFNYRFKHATTAMLEKEPAYKRQGIEVGSDNYSSSTSVGRMSLGGENGEPEIRTNNSFLHDNVD